MFFLDFKLQVYKNSNFIYTVYTIYIVILHILISYIRYIYKIWNKMLNICIKNICMFNFSFKSFPYNNNNNWSWIKIIDITVLQSNYEELIIVKHTDSFYIIHKYFLKYSRVHKQYIIWIIINIKKNVKSRHSEMIDSSAIRY